MPVNQPGEWPTDTRGIVDPETMSRYVDFARYPAGPELEGIIDWFWSVSWHLPPGHVHEQRILNHPSGHISVGTIDDSGVRLDPAQGRVYGVLTGLGSRRLSDDGWTVAAKTTVGGLGVLVDRPAVEIVDSQLDLDDALPGLDGSALLNRVNSAVTPGSAVDHLRHALVSIAAQRDSNDLKAAREVARVAALAEHDRTVCRVDQLAAAAGVSVRTLQRLFDRHVGVSPSWVIRRWRIIEAAEAAKLADGPGEASSDSWPGWAQLAAELGYADQAHLSRDFRRHLGFTPGEYLSRTGRG